MFVCLAVVETISGHLWFHSVIHEFVSFFQGTYSSHGVELVMVTHSPADHKIFGTKITV